MDQHEMIQPNYSEIEAVGLPFTTRVFRPGEDGQVNFGPYLHRMYELIGGMYFSDQDKPDQLSEAENNLSLNSTYVLAFDNDYVIGFGTLEAFADKDAGRWKDWVELGEAYVDEEYRKKGVYKKLVEERLQLAVQANARFALGKILHPEQQFQIDYLEGQGFRHVDPDKTPLYKDNNLFILDLDEWRKRYEASNS